MENVLGRPAAEAKKELTPEEAAAKMEAIERLFQRFVSENKIAVETVPVEDLDEAGNPKFETRYLVARFTLDKEEAVGIVERLEMIHLFDRIKQICFVNGMVDGITTYRREIRKLGPLKMEKALAVGQAILDHISLERKKI